VEAEVDSGDRVAALLTKQWMTNAELQKSTGMNEADVFAACVGLVDSRRAMTKMKTFKGGRRRVWRLTL
jgi:hypothetical protein